MKLAIAGSTGYLGQELIKQALSNHRITTVIAISRRETILPSKDHLLPNADPAKLKSVVVEDFMSDWTESSGCEEDLKDLDGMIW
jgi:putative NADH-flavin reductase